MPSLNPGMIATLGDLPYNFGFVKQPPIAWHSAALEWNNESGTAVEGRYHSGVGEVYAAPDYSRIRTSARRRDIPGRRLRLSREPGKTTW